MQASDEVVTKGAVSDYSVPMSEMVFNVHQEEDGGYWARSETHAIFTQGDTWEQLCTNVREVVDEFYLADSASKPQKIRLHLLHEQELLVA